MRHGGKILIDQLEAQGATTAFTVPGESFLAALDGLHDSNRIKTVVCRQEGGASMMAEAWGKITGRAGRVLRHARARRRQRHERAACRPAGLHADGAVRRHAGARARGPRGIPGDRGQAAVLLVREMGGRHSPDRAHPRIREPRVSCRALGPARARSCSACPRTCWRRSARRATPRLHACRNRVRARQTSKCCRTSWRRRSGR